MAGGEGDGAARRGAPGAARGWSRTRRSTGARVLGRAWARVRAWGLVLWAGATLPAGCGGGVARTYPEAANGGPEVPVERLRAVGEPAWDTVSTQAYVVFADPCPPCPKGAMCEPCAPESVVISPRSDPRQLYRVAGDEVVVYVRAPGQLDVGFRYRLTLARRERCVSRWCPDFDLVGYTPLE